MEKDSGSVTVRVAGSITDIRAEDWDACAGRADPFVTHAYLSALEESGSACAETGWAPQHLLVTADDDRLLACAPLYLKSHSFGEYVFDWSWADAYRRAGGRYYPKLQCAVPFTPVTGHRLLVHPEAPRPEMERLLIGAMITLAKRHQVSSLHVTFPTEGEWQSLQRVGLLGRIGQQYHWVNDGYASFDDFLSRLSSRKRKTIRKERERANGLGLTIETLRGAEIEPRHWDAFFGFYLGTVERKWANAYLNRAFFDRLGATLGDRVVMIWASHDGVPVAGALNLLGDDALYGRLWGARSDFKFLHFEACYYRAIDFAIAHGLSRVEAGAQGEHKIQRGYLPTPTFSAHWIADSGFRDAVTRFLAHEREMIGQDMSELAETGPYRRT